MNRGEWRVPPWPEVPKAGFVQIRPSGVPRVVLHADGYVIVILAAIGGLVGGIDLLRRGMPQNALWLVGLVFCLGLPAVRSTMVGLAVSRNNVRVRRFHRTVVLPWAEIDYFDLVPGPGVHRAKWSVLRVVCRNRDPAFATSIRRPRSDTSSPRFAAPITKQMWASVDGLARSLSELARYTSRLDP
jgi:hypothetical protein